MSDHRGMPVTFSRRSFLAASAGLICGQLSWTESRFNESLCWRLNDSAETAREQSSGAEYPIASRNGRSRWVGSLHERALRLDGYSVWITATERPIPLHASSMTISAWIALEAYPVNEAAIIHVKSESGEEFNLALDSLGFLLARRRGKDSSTECKATGPLARGEWHHLSAVFSESATKIYVNGQIASEQQCNFRDSVPIEGVGVTIGKTPDCPLIADVFASGVINGLVRDVQIFNSELSVRDLRQLVARYALDEAPDLQINGPWCEDDPQRPTYHALPPRAWTNEPHGLIHWGGQYHIFYQKNANGPYWGNINWGHMTSPDLYHWTEQPVALSPEPGPDCKGCWSGSVIEYNGKLAILYTGGRGDHASICLATSADGVHFSKYAGNPVIAAPPDQPGIEEFRDPHVWREGGVYYLLIGSGIKNVGGTALLYKSSDLIHWKYCKPLLIGDHENSGVFWEMPVFVQIGKEHVLIVCEVPGRASYWIGSWKDESFVPHETYPRRLELFNHLLSPTPCVLQDGRVITMGIIPDQRSAKECWRAGWAHLYSIPRALSIDDSGQLRQIPFEGIRNLSQSIASVPYVELKPALMEAVPGVSGRSMHAEMTFRKGSSRAIALRLRSSPDAREYTELRYQWEFGRLTLDRTHSSLDSSVTRDAQEVIHFPEVPDELNLEIFLDNSVLEVFVDHRSAFATRIYPTLDSSVGIFWGSEGGAASVRSMSASSIHC